MLLFVIGSYPPRTPQGTVYPWAPFVVFGSGALLAVAGTLLLPETRGQDLPDTVANLEARARGTTR